MDTKALSLIVGNHLLFAKSGQQIPGRAAGVVVDRYNKPEFNDLEGGLYKTLTDVVSVSVSTTKNTVKHRRPSPCVLKTKREIEIDSERSYTINGEGLTLFGEEVADGCKFDENGIAEIDSESTFEGWLVWQLVDDKKRVVKIVNVYGQLSVDGSIAMSSEDILKPTFVVKQLDAENIIKVNMEVFNE